MEEFFRQNLGLLSPSEVMVALSCMLNPGASEAELKQLSRVKDRYTFRRCLKHLKEIGLSIKSTLSVDQVYSMSIKSTESVDQVYTPVDRIDTPLSNKSTPPVEEVYSMDFDDALALADSMDSSGDEKQPGSPFQKRRKQQMQLLQEAWANLFDMQINQLTAKEFLQDASNEALDVYHAMQQAADRKVQYPKAYVRKVLQETVKKAKQVEAEEGLLQVTAEDRARWAENEKLLAGWTEGWKL